MIGSSLPSAMRRTARRRRGRGSGGQLRMLGPLARCLGCATCGALARRPAKQSAVRPAAKRRSAGVCSGAQRTGATAPRARGHRREDARPCRPSACQLPTPATRTPSCGSDAMARGWAREVCALLPGAPAVGLRPPGLKLHLQRGHRLLLGPRGWRWERADRCQAIFSCLCAPEASLLAGRLPAA